MKVRVIGANALRLTMVLLVVSLVLPPTHAQSDQQGDGMPGSSGSSEGSPGMPDTESTYRTELRKAEKKGKRTPTYIGALTDLGMHYNRHERYRDAIKVLREALAIVDSGVLKPTKVRVPERIVEHHDGGGTVSAEVIRQPMPYEETMGNLLPQLITAETGANELQQAEVHVKRLIALQGTNEVTDKLNLMTAYSQYADILQKMHRPKEAAQYKRKADEINKSFKPL